MKHYDEKQMQENILYLEALSEQYPNTVSYTHLTLPTNSLV